MRPIGPRNEYEHEHDTSEICLHPLDGSLARTRRLVVDTTKLEAY